jgi:hypothetical protein
MDQDWQPPFSDGHKSRYYGQMLKRCFSRWQPVAAIHHAGLAGTRSGRSRAILTRCRGLWEQGTLGFFGAETFGHVAPDRPLEFSLPRWAGTGTPSFFPRASIYHG